MTDRSSASDLSRQRPTAALDQTSSCESADPGHASEEERVRHERFHQAVRQLLSKGSLEGAVKPRKGAGGTYARLLSEQELRFLLR